MTLTDIKSMARKAAFARRKTAHAAYDGAGTAHLLGVLAGHKGAVLAGYLPIRTEIDPRPAMIQMAAFGPVCVPVIEDADRPLRFSRWTPGAALRDGPFGAQVPLEDDFVNPTVLIVPLVAFTAKGGRLGYGGGFYDRTLALLRAAGPTVAIGFAYAAQQTDTLPQDATDQQLDLIVTEQGVISTGANPD